MRQWPTFPTDRARLLADFRCRSKTGVMKQGQILFFSWVSGIAHLVMMLFTCLLCTGVVLVGMPEDAMQRKTRESCHEISGDEIFSKSA